MQYFIFGYIAYENIDEMCYILDLNPELTISYTKHVAMITKS